MRQLQAALTAVLSALPARYLAGRGGGAGGGTGRVKERGRGEAGRMAGTGRPKPQTPNPEPQTPTPKPPTPNPPSNTLGNQAVAGALGYTAQGLVVWGCNARDSGLQCEGFSDLFTVPSGLTLGMYLQRKCDKRGEVGLGTARKHLVDVFNRRSVVDLRVKFS